MLYIVLIVVQIKAYIKCVRRSEHW